MTDTPGSLNAAERAALLRWLGVARSPTAGHAPIRWEPILDYVRVSLAPLVLRAVGSGSEAPPDVVATLRAIERQLATLYLRQQAVLRTACAALDEAAVPVIVLKGAALAHLVYPDPLLRPMTDLDLWVPPHRLEDALGALAPHGLLELEGFGDSLSVTSAVAGERLLVERGTNVSVELHARVRSLAGLDSEAFDFAWTAGRHARLGGVTARVLDPEHQLVHACLHLARKDAFASGLRHLVDVARIAEHWKDSWDWPALIRSWERQNVAIWTLLVLTLARDLLGCTIPDGLENRARGRDWAAMRVLAAERLWEAGRHRLPPAVSAVVASRGTGARLAWLRSRLVDYYWRSPTPRPVGAILRDGARRLWHDLRVKVPAYLRRLIGGELRGETFDRGIALARGRAELERLVMAAGDLGYAATPGAAGPADVSPAIAGPPAPR